MAEFNHLEPRIGVACEWMGLEGGPVKRTNDGIHKVQRKPFAVHANDEIAVVSTGVRKEYAKAAVEHLLESCTSIRDMIHIGFAGSMDGTHYPKGSVLLGSSVQAHDSEAKEEISLKESMAIFNEIQTPTARVLSVDGFIGGKTNSQKLASLRDSGGVVDMEAFLTAQACMEHNVTPHVLKLVSDVIIEGRSGIRQILGLPGALLSIKNMDPVFQEMLDAIRRHRKS